MSKNFQIEEAPYHPYHPFLPVYRTYVTLIVHSSLLFVYKKFYKNKKLVLYLFNFLRKLFFATI